MTPKPTSARAAAVQIVHQLRQAGHTAYLAGGCVRDTLLGREPKDFDVATDAVPETVQRLFPKSAAVGAAFGVVIVYSSKAGGRGRWITEVATFRAEGAYTDGRRPDSVRFTTAEEDAQRRDFTINGLFADPPPQGSGGEDQVIDFVGGRADLEAGVIRAIGDAGERFGEDYLRMLRAVRFASRMGFTIEAKTSAAIRAHARYLGQISRERIGQEVLAMFSGPDPALSMRLLQDHKLDAPTLNEDHRDNDLAISGRLGQDAAAPARLAAWMFDRHGLEAQHTRTIDRWRKALSLSNDHRDTLNHLIQFIPQIDRWDEHTTAARKRLANRPVWEQGLLLYRALGESQANQADTIKKQVASLADDGIGLAPPPLLTGDDLIAQGLSPGPAFKTVLEEAYDRQLEGELADREAAQNWLKSRCS